MATRKTRPRAHVIADMSLHHLAYIITSCTFTVEPTRADYGYDLSVFTFDEVGAYENGVFYIQLKATDRLQFSRQTGDVRFRIRKRDVLTWEQEPFPVYLVVFDAQAAKAYSLHLQKYFARNGITAATLKGDTMTVRLPSLAVDMSIVRSWRDDKNAVLATMGASRHV